jgi:hypothetical protein
MKLRGILSATVLAALMTMSAVAADVTGKWTGEMPGRGGNPRAVTLELKADGATLTGTMSGAQGRQNEITEGKVNGDQVSFVVKNNFQGNEVKTTYNGKVAGDELKLTVQREGAEPREVTLKKAN